MADERYKVVIGLAVTKDEDNAEFADFGLVYSHMDYKQMVQVEAAFAQHADEINAGLKGLIGDLVQMGVDEISVRMPGKGGPQSPGR